MLCIIISLNPNFFTGIFYTIVNSIPFLNNYLSVYRVEEFKHYGLSTGIIIDVLLVIYFMFHLKNLNSKERFLYNIFYISVILSLLLVINPAALRLNYYFRMSNIFLIPLLYNKIKVKIIPYFIIIGLSILYLLTTFFLRESMVEEIEI